MHRTHFGLAVLILVSASCTEGAPGKRGMLGIEQPLRTTVVGAQYIVDPVPVASSPLSVSLSKTTISGYKYRFSATGAGASSGLYDFTFVAEDCNSDNTCSQPGAFYSATGGSATVDFESYGAPAYTRVQVMAHEHGSASYYSTLSNALLVRGPNWGQGGGNGFSCTYPSYPFNEVVSGNTTRAYRRNLCTGAKEPQ